MTESQKFTCSNPSCGRAFVNPIKAKNLAAKEAEPYAACPYCLTEIVLVEELKPEAKEIKVREPSERLAKEEPAPADTKTLGCTHHFGYLSKRPTKEKIPEECIVCESIVKCMLKNVTG